MISKLAKSIAHFFVVQNITEESKEVIYAYGMELLLSDIALNASNANTFQTTYEGLKTSIDNQRSSVSGVDKDEEAVSLVKYQNSYTLASKMIQTLTEIYDQLILNTGV